MDAKNKQGEEPRAVPTVSTIFPTGDLIELVYDARSGKTALAVGSARGWTVKDSIPFGNTRLVPWNAENNLIKHEAILLPERPEDFGSVDDLVSEIEAYLARYIDLSDGLRKVVTGYILLTWVYDAFNELPYLRFRGDLGSGKTRALVVAGGLACRAFFASGASTVSPIFHTLDAFKGTLILDEADFRFSDEKAELSKILNNGNVRGFPVLRTMITPKQEFDPRAFSVFGPKMIAMRGRFDDPALESRFITIEMDRGKAALNAPINLPDVQKDEARSLRNKLLGYRLSHRLGVSINESLYDPSLSPRANQVTLPLLSLLDDPELRRVARDIVRETQADTLADRAASIAGQLVALLVEYVVKQKGATISVADLTTAFIEQHGSDYERPITNRHIGSILRRELGIRPYKSHGTYQVPLRIEKVAVLADRFGVETVTLTDRVDEVPMGT